MTMTNENSGAASGLSAAGSVMDVQTALGVADKYSQPSSGIGCLHAEAYETLAYRVRELEERGRKCATMDEAEKYALIRAIQEIGNVVGLTDDNSPREIVERVRLLSRNTMKELKKTDYPRSFYRSRAADAMRSARKRDNNRDWYLGRYSVWCFIDSSFNATIEAAERWHK